MVYIEVRFLEVYPVTDGLLEHISMVGKIGKNLHSQTLILQVMQPLQIN
jgi:hypothetical protein